MSILHPAKSSLTPKSQLDYSIDCPARVVLKTERSGLRFQTLDDPSNWAQQDPSFQFVITKGILMGKQRIHLQQLPALLAEIIQLISHLTQKKKRLFSSNIFALFCPLRPNKRSFSIFQFRRRDGEKDPITTIRTTVPDKIFKLLSL